MKCKNSSTVTILFTSWNGLVTFEDAIYKLVFVLTLHLPNMYFNTIFFFVSLMAYDFLKKTWMFVGKCLNSTASKYRKISVLWTTQTSLLRKNFCIALPHIYTSHERTDCLYRLLYCAACLSLKYRFYCVYVKDQIDLYSATCNTLSLPFTAILQCMAIPWTATL
jgi:hypothetical protein